MSEDGAERGRWLGTPDHKADKCNDKIYFAFDVSFCLQVRPSRRNNPSAAPRLLRQGERGVSPLLQCLIRQPHSASCAQLLSPPPFPPYIPPIANTVPFTVRKKKNTIGQLYGIALSVIEKTVPARISKYGPREARNTRLCSHCLAGCCHAGLRLWPHMVHRLHARFVERQEEGSGGVGEPGQRLLCIYTHSLFLALLGGHLADWTAHR